MAGFLFRLETVRPLNRALASAILIWRARARDKKRRER
jgi:hypothetical protein